MSNTGLTVYDIEDNRFVSASNKFKGTRYQRMFMLEKKFEEYISKYPPKLVIIEGFAFGARQYREVLGEASYAVKRCFLMNNKSIPSLIVSPTALKKFACLRGRGVDKKDIFAAVQKKWSAQVKNHDEADSYVLCKIGIFVLSVVTSVVSFGKHKKKRFVVLSEENWLGKLKKERKEVLINLISNDGSNIGRFFNGVYKEDSKKAKKKGRDKRS